MVSPAEPVEAAFAEAGIPAEGFQRLLKTGPPSPIVSFTDSHVVLSIAVSKEGVPRLRHEVASREWAKSLGIAVPDVLAVGGTWFLARWERVREPSGPDYVTQAIEAADVLAAARQPVLPGAGRSWRAPRKDLAVRIIRLGLGGLPLLEFRRARKAAGLLSDVTLGHGDYYRRNVLASERGGVTVVDWEFLGTYPALTDHVRLWSTLFEPEDRALAWEMIEQRASGLPRNHLPILKRWMLHRLLAENLSAPRSQQNQKDLSHARAMLRSHSAMSS